jgi:predicted lipoprotein with Yx(FWY)xxD motif
MSQPERSDRRHALLLRIAAATVAAGALSAYVIVAASATPSPQTKNVVVSTAKNATLGTILVSGTTLYTLKPSKTACTTQCLKIWPALLLPKNAKKATAGVGVSAAKLGTIKRPDGALQVTYNGKALYRFFEDTAAGQVRGNAATDTWGTWSVIVTAKPALTSSSAAAGTSSPTPTTTATAGTSPTATTAPTVTTSPTSTTSSTPTTTIPKSTTTTTTPGTGGVAF